MASVKKSILPLKPSLNPKIGTTTIAKPIVKQPLVSKVSTPVVVKKSAVAAKTTSEKITAVKTTPLLKSTSIKSAVPSSPAKTPTKPSTISSPVKVTSPVKSAADSTSTLKIRSVVKSSVKAPSVTLTKPVSKSIAPTPAVKKLAINTSKSASVTIEKSTAVVATKVSGVKSSIVPSTPVKARSLSITNTKSPSVAAKTSKPVASKNPPSTLTKTSTKLTSAPLSSKLTKTVAGGKTSSKSSTTVKPTSAITAAKKSATTRDVIKRVQDASEIEIRDADSTTLEEREIEECTSKDSSVCENEKNGEFKQSSEVDEKRVYAVAEQLICVMQPEELEVITGDGEQLHKDSSYVSIDMSAVEAEEMNTESSTNDTVLVPEAQLQTLSTSDEETHESHIETESDLSPSDVIENTTYEKVMIFEMCEINSSSLVDVLEENENTLSEERTSTESSVDDEDTESAPLATVEDEEMTTRLVEHEMLIESHESNDPDELFENAPSTSFDIETFVHPQSVENVLENEVRSQYSYSDVPSVFGDAEFENLSGVEPTADEGTAEESEESGTLLVEIGLEADDGCEQQLVKDEPSPLTDDSISCHSGFVENNESEELLPRPTAVCDAESSPNSIEMTTAQHENKSESGSDVTSNFDDVRGENFSKTDEPVSVEVSVSKVEVDDFLGNLPEVEVGMNAEPELMIFNEIPVNSDQNEDELICLGHPLNVNSFTNCANIESEFRTPNNERSGDDLIELTSENFMAFGNFEDVINMSYADVLLTSKSSTDDDSLEMVNNDLPIEACKFPPLIHVPDNEEIASHSVVSADETVEDSQVSVTVVDSDVGSIPVYSIYDNTEFPDAVPSDEHYEKQDHHEVDQHDETFHKIRHKRNKRRNKKNRKSVSSGENMDEESPKNVHSEKPNYQAQYNGRNRRNSRRWRNSRAYFEAFHQAQQSNQQEYYRDSHWKYTDAKSD